MSRPFEVRECEHGVEITANITKHLGQLHELLTIEEAESLATDLMNVAQELRRKREFGDCARCGEPKNNKGAVCPDCFVVCINGG